MHGFFNDDATRLYQRVRVALRRDGTRGALAPRAGRSEGRVAGAEWRGSRGGRAGRQEWVGWKHSPLPSVPRRVRWDGTLSAPACQTQEFEEGILAQTKNRTLRTSFRGRKLHLGVVTGTWRVCKNTLEKVEKRLPRTKTAAVSRMTGIIRRRLGLSGATPPPPGGRGPFQKATPTPSLNSTDSPSPGRRRGASVAQQHLQLELFPQ